jgi:hypothetical protein
MNSSLGIQKNLSPFFFKKTNLILINDDKKFDWENKTR